MKLVRYGAYGGEKPGLIDADGALRDISHLVGDIAGGALSADMLDMLGKLETEMLPVVKDAVRYGACVGGTRNFIGISGNYPRGQKAEASDEPAKRTPPVIFNKAPTCIVGAQDPIMLPKGAPKVDWGAELAVVINRRGSHIREEQALDYVAGYCICNDLTERGEEQEGAGQLVKAKSAATFGPLGPWLVTTEEVQNPHALSIFVELNGKRVQSGSTADMIYRVPELIAYISRFMALEPGDVIATGSPFGTGQDMKTPVFLKKGDRLKIGIDGLGAQEAKILAWID